MNIMSMLVVGSGKDNGAEKNPGVPSRVMRWLKRDQNDDSISAPKHPEGDIEEIVKENEKLVKRLGDAIGTHPLDMLDYEDVESTMKFLRKMRTRRMPGSVEVMIGDNKYTRGYFIGVIECPAEPQGSDENGPFYTGFTAEVVLCEGGELRAQPSKMFTRSAFEVGGEAAPLPEYEYDLDYILNPDLFSSIESQGIISTGRVVTDSRTEETRFYPLSLEQLLEGIAAKDSPPEQES
jgi:hypothetical protein